MASKVKNQINESVTLRLTAADLTTAADPSFVAVNLDQRNGMIYEISAIAFGLCLANPADEALIERLTIAIQRDVTLPSTSAAIDAVDLAGDESQVFRLDARAPLTRLYSFDRPRQLDAGQRYSAFLFPVVSANVAGTSILSLTLIGEIRWRSPGSAMII
jgi:hypothetical protein